MAEFKAMHPEFYAKYKATRRIVQPAVNPKNKTKAKATTPTVTVPEAA